MIPRRDRVARELEQATRARARTGVDNKVRVVRDIGDFIAREKETT